LPLFLPVLAWAIVFGALAARMARSVSRPVALWALYGAILGPVALLLLRVAPPGRCRRCESRVHGWEFVCRFCGEDVQGAPDRRTPTGPMQREVGPEPPVLTVTPSIVDPLVAPPRAANTRNVDLPTALSAAPRRPQPAGPAPVPVPAPEVAAGRPVVPEARLRRRRGREKAEPGRTVGAGLFLTGSASLQPGFRYAIAVSETRLRILGPLDIDPEKVVVDRDLAPFDAVVTDDRVMLTEGSPDRPRLFLVFERISGTTPEGLADEIVAAVRAVPRAG